MQRHAHDFIVYHPSHLKIEALAKQSNQIKQASVTNSTSTSSSLSKNITILNDVRKLLIPSYPCRKGKAI